MRFVSQLLQPALAAPRVPATATANAAEFTCNSQRLLVECGVVRSSGGGGLTLLPLGARALHKLELLAARCIESVGGQRVWLPTLTPVSLWERSGRLEAGGQELMTLEDRHQRKYLLAPTHEECVAELLASLGPLSRRQLPLLLYQVSRLFRDERRPKHGLLRAREFAMLAAYGAHSSGDCARAQYGAVTQAYRALFRRMGLNVHRVSADNGAMGGSESHEWQLPAAAGEDRTRVCASCSHAQRAPEGERDGDSACERCGAKCHTHNSIEVGHTFVLGTAYSSALGASLVAPAPSEASLAVHMNCYGIGLTRLLAASVEALSSDRAIVWPRAIAPFSALVLGPKEGSKEWSCLGPGGVGAICRALRPTGRDSVTGDSWEDDDTLVDDRHHLTVGKRLLMAEKCGYPTIVVAGRALLEPQPRVEVWRARAKPGAPGYDVTLVRVDDLAHVTSATANANAAVTAHDEAVNT